MRIRFLVVAGLLMALAAPAFAADAAKTDIKGLYLLTDYPAVTVQPGTTSTINLHCVITAWRRNGWRSPFPACRKAGRRRSWAAASRSPRPCRQLTTVSRSICGSTCPRTPKSAPDVHGECRGAERDARRRCRSRSRSAKELPAKLSIQPQLPSTARLVEFEFRIHTHGQERQRQEARWSASPLSAPQNFDTSFTEAYGSQQLTAIPVDAGKSKDVKLKVTPPSTVDAGRYPVTVRVAAEGANADTQVTLDITGQPKLDIAGREGLLSARATAGKDATIPVDGQQHRYRAGRARQAVRHRAERLEGQLRAEGDRPHRAQPEQGSAGDDHAARKGDRRRLRRRPLPPPARGESGSAALPRHRHHLDDVGRRRRRHHRRSHC